MVAPIRRQELLDAAGVRARGELARVSAGVEGAIVHAEAQRTLQGALGDAYIALRESRGARAALTSSDVVAAYTARLAAQLEGKTGTGRSAELVSQKEAASLPPELAKVYAELAATKRRAELERLAAKEPFPKGVVDAKLVLQRYLPEQARAAAEAVDGALKLFARLDALEATVAKRAADEGGPLEADGVRAVPVEGREALGERLGLHSGETRLALVTDEALIAVQRTDDPMYGAGIALVRFARGNLIDALGATTKQTGEGGLLALLARHDRRADELGVRAGIGQVDREGLELLTRAANALMGATPKAVETARTALEALAMTERETLGALAHRGGWGKQYAALAARVQAEGELSLGDADTRIAVQDRFVRYRDDEPVELVAGQGPLLVVDNSFGGLGHAIPLAALAEGRLEVHVFHETTKLGVLRVDADGTAREAPGAVAMARVAADLGEYLPAMLAQRDEA
jgi:hypothetical protein